QQFVAAAVFRRPRVSRNLDPPASQLPSSRRPDDDPRGDLLSHARSPLAAPGSASLGYAALVPATARWHFRAPCRWPRPRTRCVRTGSADSRSTTGRPASRISVGTASRLPRGSAVLLLDAG